MILGYHMISQGHVTKGSCNFMELIKVIYRLAKFVCHKHCGSEDIMILVCHVILQDHMFKDDATL